MKRLIYIAGPYTSDPVVNTKAAIVAADRIVHYGATPYIPHLNHFWNEVLEHNYEFWMDQGFEFLCRCDGLIRLPGASSGADREVREALARGIPIFDGVEDFITKTVDADYKRSNSLSDAVCITKADYT